MYKPILPKPNKENPSLNPFKNQIQVVPKHSQPAGAPTSNNVCIFLYLISFILFYFKF